MRVALPLIALLLAAPAMAQDSAAIPDPASVAVPAVTDGRDPGVVKNGWKHFYFWREGVSYRQAYADFADCYRFLPVAGGNAMLPAFIAWKGPESIDRVPGGIGPYGLVGDAIGAMVAGPIARRASQSRMRRCLEPRGYQRFPASEDTWKAIVDGYSRASIAVSAKLASGPRPDAEPLAEDR